MASGQSPFIPKTSSHVGMGDRAVLDMDGFESLRSDLMSSGQEKRVDVNQRHLIDKILARYATQFSVFRELLQNSDDARATVSEIYFSTVPSPSGVPSQAGSSTLSLHNIEEKLVTKTVYRNNGTIFTEEDWSRLTCIASGNPNPDHIGFFGVGSFTLFSICDEPLVVSGSHALVFRWRGDALFTKLAPCAKSDAWTSFILTARDNYPVPSFEKFGSFLASSLTFTSSLSKVRVFVDDKMVLCIGKTLSTAPSVISVPQSSSWWSRDLAVLRSPSNLFHLARQAGAIVDTEVSIVVESPFNREGTMSVSGRLISAEVIATIPSDISNRMQRVTKKRPPQGFKIHLAFPSSDCESDTAPSSRHVSDASASVANPSFLSGFAPRVGAGRIYIGFQTSQTTGVACHVSAPFIPTVEREAVDLVDHTLRTWNSDLLFLSGVVMRLALEHSMSGMSKSWEAEAPQRQDSERNRLHRLKEIGLSQNSSDLSKVLSDSQSENASNAQASNSGKRERGNFFSGFANFMGQAANEVKRIVTKLPSLVGDDDSAFLAPDDSDAISSAEKHAIVLMRSFEPTPSSPDPQIGALIANGFEKCMPTLLPPVLSQTGVVRGNEALLPCRGIEKFAPNAPVIRWTVLKNVTNYARHVAKVDYIDIPALAESLQTRTMSEEELLMFFAWLSQYGKKYASEISNLALLKSSLCFHCESSGCISVVPLKKFVYFASENIPQDVPLPPNVLPRQLAEKMSTKQVERGFLRHWFKPLPWESWANFVVGDDEFTSNTAENGTNLRVLDAFALEWSRRRFTLQEREFQIFLRGILARQKCIPSQEGDLRFPDDLYLNSSELEMFSSTEIAKVSLHVVRMPHISSSFLVAAGVREALTPEILFQELSRLRWTEDPEGLVRYLMAVSDKLTSDEWRRLREAKILPSHLDSDLHAPQELFFPSVELKNLRCIPVLRWNQELSQTSKEGVFLTSCLGLRTEPPLYLVLQVASRGNVSSDMRARCIQFAASKIEKSETLKHEFSRDTASTSLKFMPSVKRNLSDPGKAEEFALRSVRECYVDSSSSVLGFWTVHAHFEKQARVFGVLEHPPGRDSIRALKILCTELKRCDRLPAALVLNSMLQAFKYLSENLSRCTENDLASLRSLDFIPTLPTEAEGTVIWRRPSQVIFKADNLVLSEVSNLFDVVEESALLRRVGVRDEPCVLEICTILLSDPQSVLGTLGGVDKYRALLQYLASRVSNLPKGVIADLSRCAFLLATKLQTDTTEETNFEDSYSQPVTHSLAIAKDIVIVDDALLQRMFNPLSAPLDTGLESLYSALGSSYLSAAVARRFEIPETPQQNGTVSPTSQAVRKAIVQRRCLILSSATRDLRASAQKLLTSGLQVVQVDWIRCCYVLQGVRRIQDLSCCAVSFKCLGPKYTSILSPSNGSTTLCVTKNVDYFDVAGALGSQLFVRCSLQDTFLLAQLLETSIPQLRARGFPVDKIVSESDQVSPTTESPANIAGQFGASAVESGIQTPATNCVKYQKMLSQVFPDADPGWISQKLSTNPTENTFQSVRTEMHSRGYPRKIGSLPSGSPNPETASPSTRTEGTEDISEIPLQTSGESIIRRPSKSGLERALRAFRSLSLNRPTLATGLASSSPQNVRQTVSSNLGPLGSPSSAHGRPTEIPSSSPETKLLLEQGIRLARPVREKFVENKPQVASTPDASNISDFCEMVPGHELQHVRWPSGACTSTCPHFRVFATRAQGDHAARAYILQNWNVVEEFSKVLGVIREVFDLDYRSIAVFYAPQSRSIAFNSSGSLYFNLHFHMAFLQKSYCGIEGYSHWYTTFCHEIAHNLAAHHNQVHGFYTELYVERFLPRFIARMQELALLTRQ